MKHYIGFQLHRALCHFLATEPVISQSGFKEQFWVFPEASIESVATLSFCPDPKIPYKDSGIGIWEHSETR